MDMISTGNAGGAALKIPGSHKAIPLDKGLSPRVFKSIGQTGGGIALNRNVSSPMRIERPGMAAIPLKGGTDAVRDAKFREAARGFEAIFTRQLLKTMRTTVPGAGLYGSGAAGDIYGDMIENGLSETMSEQGRLGIARLLVNRFESRRNSGIREAVMPPAKTEPDSGASFPGP